MAVGTEERRNTHKVVRERGIGTHVAVDRKTAVGKLERATERAVGVQGGPIRKRESEGRKDLGGEEVGEGGEGAATKEDVSSTSITDQTISDSSSKGGSMRVKGGQGLVGVNRESFCEKIPFVERTTDPSDGELTLADTVAGPVKAHVNRF